MMDLRYYGCVTGDCPHEFPHECLSAIIKVINEQPPVTNADAQAAADTAMNCPHVQLFPACRECVAKLVAKVRAEEREACARIADAGPPRPTQIATAIRQRTIVAGSFCSGEGREDCCLSFNPHTLDAEGRCCQHHPDDDAGDRNE